jgi:hypothetical protein
MTATRTHDVVDFDSRGRAIVNKGTGRRALLDTTGIEVSETDPVTGASTLSDTAKLKRGYNPYHSGHLVKKRWKKKRDMRKLSKWIEARKLADGDDSD